MFIDTVSASELRDNLKSNLAKVEGDSALQVTHKDGSIRVLITQEYFLTLVSRLAAYERTAGATVPRKSADDILREVVAKQERMAVREKDI